MRRVEQFTLHEDDIVVFYFKNNTPISYRVNVSFLKNFDNRSNNSKIFEILHISDKYKYCSEAYGYQAGYGDWPTCKVDDYEALASLVRKISSHEDVVRVTVNGTDILTIHSTVVLPLPCCIKAGDKDKCNKFISRLTEAGVENPRNYSGNGSYQHGYYVVTEDKHLLYESYSTECSYPEVSKLIPDSDYSIEFKDPVKPIYLTIPCYFEVTKNYNFKDTNFISALQKAGVNNFASLDGSMHSGYYYIIEDLRILVTDRKSDVKGPDLTSKLPKNKQFKFQIATNQSKEECCKGIKDDTFDNKENDCYDRATVYKSESIIKESLSLKTSEEITLTIKKSKFIIK